MVVRRLISAAVALACLGLALVLFCPADPAFFVAGGVGLGLMFAAILIGLKAQRLASDEPEDLAYAEALENGHENPGAVAMMVKGQALIKEGRISNNIELVRKGEKLVNRAQSLLGGGK